MNVEQMMEEHGFRLAAGCSGKAAYTKFVKFNGKRAYVSVTDASGQSFPTAAHEPVMVTTYDLKSGDEVEAGKIFETLDAYLSAPAEE